MTLAFRTLIVVLLVAGLLPSGTCADEPEDKKVRLIWFPRFSPDGKWLLSAHGSWDAKEGGEARVWNVDDGEVKYVLKHPRGVRSVAWSPKGTFFVTGAYGGMLRFYDPASGKQLHELKLAGSVEGARVSRDEKRLVTTHGSGDVRVLELPSRKEMYHFQGAHQGGIWGMAISPNGKLAATAGQDAHVRLYDLDSFKIVHAIKHPGETNGVLFTDDNKHLLTGCSDSIIRVFDAASGKKIAELEGHERGSISDMQLYDGGKRLASAGIDGTVRLWDVSDLENPKLLHTLRGHSNLVFGVAVSPDDKHLASAGWDDKLILWDLDKREERWSWKR